MGVGTAAAWGTGQPPTVLHTLSLGGYTFAQMLLLRNQDLGCHSRLARCLQGSLDGMVLRECARRRGRKQLGNSR